MQGYRSVTRDRAKSGPTSSCCGPWLPVWASLAAGSYQGCACGSGGMQWVPCQLGAKAQLEGPALSLLIVVGVSCEV